MDTKPFEIFTRSPLWAIRPEAIETILHLSSPWKVKDWAEGWGVAQPSVLDKGNGTTATKVAVIPIRGVLTKDGPAWYGSNYDTITSALESAGSDPAVKRVVLAVDSPGGEVTGLPETAAVLAGVAKQKPVSAIVEGTSASAAYWLTSQANDVTLTPSGEVGSVGVRMMHTDLSKMLDDMGVKITELSSGDFKTEWSPYKPLSEDAKADMQTRLSATHNDFIKAVAAGRAGRASVEVRRNRFGEGRMFTANDAMTHGLVDKVQSARDFYRTIMQPAEAPAFGLKRALARVELERQRF
jgi:signal peptide peptidase SppA